MSLTDTNEHGVLDTFLVRDLHDDANIRFEPGDLHGLTASIRQLGILVPLTVRPVAGDETSTQYEVVAGHRRLAVAKALGMSSVPAVCIEVDDPVRVLAMLEENIERESLTEAEVVKAYEQLSLAGWSNTKIAKHTRTKRDDVKRALSIVDNDDLIANLHTGQLTFDQAASLGELDLEADQVEGLIKLADDQWKFKHALRGFQIEAASAAAEEQARADGLRLIDDLDEDAWPDAEECILFPEFANIKSDDVTVKHAKCKGHAVQISIAYDDLAVHHRAWCLDPVKYKHRKSEAAEIAEAVEGGYGPLADKADRAVPDLSVERKEVIANNKAWRTAEGVRREFLTELFGRKTAPAKADVFSISLVATRPQFLTDTRCEDTITLLTGAKGQGYSMPAAAVLVAGGAEKDLRFNLLKITLCAVEARSDVSIWRRAHPDFATYLHYLSTIGYTLSDVEQLVIDTNDKHVADKETP